MSRVTSYVYACKSVGVNTFKSWGKINTGGKLSCKWKVNSFKGNATNTTYKLTWESKIPQLDLYLIVSPTPAIFG